MARCLPGTAEFAAAECAIRQLQARYIDAVWRFDYASFADCFAEDCEWRIDGVVLKGRESIVEFNRKLFTAQFRKLLLTLRTPVLEVGDGRASGRTYFSAHNLLADGRAFTPCGVYYEHFVDQGDRWRFQWRLFETLYAGPPDLSGQWFDQPDYGAPPAMPPLDAETLVMVGTHKEIEQAGGPDQTRVMSSKSEAH